MDEMSEHRAHKMQRARWRRFLPLALLIAIVLVGGVVYAIPALTLPVRTALSAKILPQELAGYTFVADSTEGSIAYRADGFGFESEDLGGTLVSASESEDASARLILSDGTYRIMIGRDTYVNTAAPLSGLTRSPNGNTIAYSKRTSIKARPPVNGAMLPTARLSPEDWSVQLLDTRTGATHEIGTGIWPTFLDDQHLLYVTPLGMYVADISTGASVRILEKTFELASPSVLASPDRTLMGVEDLKTRTATVYRVTPTTAEAVATLPMTERAMSFALSNTDLYILRTSRFGTEIYKESIAGGPLVKAATLPENFRVSRILIHSL